MLNPVPDRLRQGPYLQKVDMNSKQISLVKGTWHLVEQLDSQTVGSLFYSRLLDENPELRPLFRTPVPEQSKKLITMISYVIHRLDRLDTVIEDVKKLALRHVQYGVKENYYAMVGAALLWTLEKGLSDLWNQEIQEAWVACYTLLSSAMMEASNYAPVV